MLVVQAYRFALDPTPSQARALASHCGAARVVFNWGLARIKANLDRRAAERSYGLKGDQLTPPLSWSIYALRKAWNAAKHEVAPWWAEAQRSRIHHRVAALRGDALHKLTTRLAREYGTIVVEDLNVAGLVRNRRLARVISDAGFGEIRRQLTYKTAWQGGILVVAGRWFPSSKTCSGCGAVKAKLPLRVRTFARPSCGLVMDRDVNAARNPAALVGRHVAGSGPVTRNGRGADRKTPLGGAGGCEASTPHRDTGQDGDFRPATGESLRRVEAQ
ncbi:RNA-guided endonuclease TnpB family protein [Nonomuraea sp. B12E4]|uniref:RNA-guided endonuclease TnpB family protein n=1 Tax=Nonomuraea sp. B12E4 TaxID=3153564 RepID=UPI00325F6811